MGAVQWVLALLVCALLPLVPSAQSEMKCARWAWTSCVDLGQGLHVLSLNSLGSSAMRDKHHYTSGTFEMDVRLPAGYSGGVIFAFYLMDTITKTNKDLNHSEIDIEFYGNTSARAIHFNLNVFADGHQNLAEFTLPWDPSAAFHKYGITVSTRHIIWTVDRWPIRVLARVPGQPWPRFAMQPQASVWHSTWTPLQPDFTNGPIGALFSNYRARGCVAAEDEEVLSDLDTPSCPGPWNDLLQLPMIAAYEKLNGDHQLTDWGWDAMP